MFGKTYEKIAVLIVNYQKGLNYVIKIEQCYRENIFTKFHNNIELTRLVII